MQLPLSIDLSEDFAFRDAVVGMAELDVQGRWLQVNDAAVRMLGHPRGALLGADLAAVSHVDDAPQQFTAMQQLLAGARTCVEREQRFRRPDGSYLLARATLSMAGAGAGTASFLLQLHGLTYRRQVEDALADREAALAAMRDSEQRFRTTFEQAAVGIAHVALDGRWLRVNNALCTFFGYTQAQLLPLTFQQLTHPKDLAADLALLHRLLAGQIEDYRIEKRYIHQDGRPLWALLTVSLVRDDDGAPLHFISVVEDIGARKLVEAALQRSQHELESRVAARTSELEIANRALSAQIAQRGQIENALRDSEARTRSILENSHDAFVAIDEAGNIVEWNRAAETIFGWRRSEAIGRELGDLIVPPAQRVAHRSGMARLLASGEQRVIGRRLQMSAMHRSGREFPVELTISQVAVGQRQLFTAFLHDITDRVVAEQRLNASEARLRTVTDNVPAMIAYVDCDLRYRFNNAAYRDWIAQDPLSLAGKHMREVLGPDMYAHAQPYIRRAMDGERVTFDRPFPLATGGAREGHVVYIPDCDAAGGVRGLYIMVSDITAHKQLARVLEKRALQDELTGLPNRAAWAGQFERGLARAQRSGSPAVVMFLDLDGFKQVNDLYGHEGGDAMLREFAARLTASVRKGDTVARFAGDEFVILLENISAADAGRCPPAIARKILAAMAPAFDFRGQPLQLSTSIGVAVQAEGPVDGERLLRRADEAMYAAKRNGGNRFEISAAV